MQAGDFRWPDRAYVAVVFNMSWESWPKVLATANNRQRAGEVVPADAKYGRNPRIVYEHAYGETAGMQRLLDLWRRHKIRTSCYADGLNVHLYPGLAHEAAADGHEFLAQGWDHTYLWDQTVEQQIASIERTVATFVEVLGKKPTCVYRKSNSAILVVKSTENWPRNDDTKPFNGSMNWGVLV